MSAAKEPAGTGRPERAAATPAPALTSQQKAAIVIGALGAEAAGPLLERLDEQALRGFAEGMAQLRRIEPETVNATIREFLNELTRAETAVRGGLKVARGMLSRHVDEGQLLRILDDVDVPSVHNVWRKLGRVNEDALAEFLKREHPQTAAVVLSKLSPELAARILSRFEPDRARDVVIGITKAQSLDHNVIETIGASVSRDFLAGQNADGVRRDPAERVGAIMNFTAADIRAHVLDRIAETQPDFAEQIKRKMFTFEDIPARVEHRDVSAVVRAADREVLLRALADTARATKEAVAFILGNISSRMAEQIREELKDLGKVRRKDSEEAQNEIIGVIRAMVENGEIKLVVQDEDG